MPAEIRQLIFTPEETVVAVLNYRRRLNEKLPPGGPRAVRLEGGESEGHPIRLFIDMAKEDTTLVTDGPALVAALIMRCRDTGVRLPLKAEKQLLRMGGQVALKIVFNPDGAALPEGVQG